MDRRLIFPAVAITAWAQQPSPVPAETEAALRARVDQFYQLQIDKKFRQAEEFVAEDTKDDYYNRAKPAIKASSIQKIEWSDNNSRARVTLKQRIVVKTPVGDQEFDMLPPANWKFENGQWFWYIDHDAPHQTPFGLFPQTPRGTANGPVGPPPPPPGKIDVAKLMMNQVTVDNTSVVLTTSNPAQAVTVSNDLPGSVTLALEKPLPEGIAVELEKAELKSGEKGAIRFLLRGEAKGSGMVRVVASPLGKVFEISVQSK
jgi:hypothetical protein